MTSFEARNLSTHYGRTQALFDVTLPTLGPGEILGLLGPNASGKSTLMRCLSREKQSSGRILLDGFEQKSIGHARWHEQVGSMPQTPPAPSALLPTELMWSTARALALDLSDSELAAKIEQVFTRLGLEAVALAPLNTLSGGKRQLVGLALALIRDPGLLLLDEPTAALDLHWRMAVLETVREEISRRGGIVIAALHDLDLAARYCDQIALLEQGHIVAAGSPQSVLTPEMLAKIYHVEAETHCAPDGSLRIDVLRPIRSSMPRL